MVPADVSPPVVSLEPVRELAQYGINNQAYILDRKQIVSIRRTKITPIARRVEVAQPATNAIPTLLHGAPQVEALTTARNWGWLPTLTLVSACGLLLVALADTLGRNNEALAQPLFWLGLVVLYAPIAMRVALQRISRREVIGLVTWLGLMLYLVKVLHSPFFFTIHDEFYHWRTANDILYHHELFYANPLLPVSALFPGQENAAAALASLTGLPIFYAGIVIVGLARLILTLALFLFYEQVSQSTQVAGIGSLLYMANPNYLFFLSMFKYQSLAIPFAMLVLFLMARRAYAAQTNRVELTLAVLLALGVVVTTHHTTSYALTALLICWTVFESLPGRKRSDRTGVGGIALLAFVASLAWLLYVANITLGYLAKPLGNALSGVVRMIAQDPDAARQVFRSSGGQIAPLWERLTGFTAVGLILLGLPFGLVQIWRQYRARAVVLVLGCGALLYPPSLAFRLAKGGWETSNRSSELLFVAIGLVLAIGLVKFVLHDRSPWLGAIAFSACASLIFMGGLIVGWPRVWRLPGPYVPLADTRSVESQGLSAAAWARSYLGPGNVFGADKTNQLLMGSYGEQNMTSTLNGGVNVSWILFAPKLEARQIASLRRGRIHYLVIDRRIEGVPSAIRPYYPGGSIRQAFEKFDQLKHVSRPFDSGDIIIYDVGALAGVP
jgi:hypothetical protein